MDNLDIDDLLDDAESHLSKFHKGDKCSNITNQKSSISNPRNKISLDDDIDEILNCDIDGCKVKQNLSPNSSQVEKIASSQKKCVSLHVGGSATSEGCGTSLSVKSCDNLRCTACDFKIMNFKNFTWKSSTDYLFLRNNYPEESKLKKKLLPKEGCRAFCCQCQYLNVSSLQEVKRHSSLQWVCGKH